MGYTARIRKGSGEIVRLTSKESQWQIARIDGLSSTQAMLNMTNIYGMDGARLNSAKLSTRNIVILMKINGDVEGNRQTLENLFVPKSDVRFYFQNRNRDVFADAIVESVDCDPFSMAEMMQVSMICPNPYFFDRIEDSVELSNSQAGFEFPFFINRNDPVPFGSYQSGRTTMIDTETGTETPFRLYVSFLDDVSYFLWIQNLDTGEYIRITYPFIAGDELYINTNPASLTVRLTRGGSAINLFPYLDEGSTLMQLHPGENWFGYSADAHLQDDKVQISLKYRKLYTGV